MNLKEAILEKTGQALERIGFLPPDGSPQYYNYGPAADQHGDARDCDDPEELAKYLELFSKNSQPPTTD